MTDPGDTDEAQLGQQEPRPNPDLQSLDRLVGTWRVSGEAVGTVTYEWAEGGFFLFQHVDLDGTRGLEVIGHEQKYGEPPSADIRSRYFGFSSGETLEYTHEVRGDVLTIWSGERGSPAYYEGTFSEDGRTLTGAWHFPGGGGYSTVSTKVDHPSVGSREPDRTLRGGKEPAAMPARRSVGTSRFRPDGPGASCWPPRAVPRSR